jgi:hypothetical protein
VDTQEAVEPDPDPEPAEEFPVGGRFLAVVLVLELLPRPVGCLLGGEVEVGGLVDDTEVVVAHQRPLAALGDDLHALHRAGAVAQDVTQADDAIHALRVDVIHDHRQRLEVGVDIADDGGSHGRLRNKKSDKPRRPRGGRQRSHRGHAATGLVSPPAGRAKQGTVPPVVTMPPAGPGITKKRGDDAGG